MKANIKFLNALSLLFLIFPVFICVLVGPQLVFAQNKLTKPVMLKGRVIPSDGALDDFYVRVKMSGAAAVEPDGRFSLLIRALPDTVKFVAPGFFPTERILRKESDLLDFMIVRVVARVNDLHDVQVSTGYQRVRPNEMTGDISLVDEKMLNARTGTNILDRLIGQTSGLTVNIGKTNSNPQNRTGLSVRGLGTINGPLDPLIVLDGFIYEGDINNINPFDIESVSLLKDAAASSIWGARAGNGVIVISSKRAKLNQSLNVSFNANATVRTLPDLGNVSQMTNEEAIESERFLFDRGYFNSRINSNFYALSPAVELFLARRNGRLTDAQVEQGLNAFRANDVKKQWLDEFYTRALTQQYALNIRTGTVNHAFGLGAGYDRSYDQNYATSERSNLTFSDQINIGSKLTLLSSLQLTFAKTGSGRPAFGSIRNAGRQSYQSLRDADGNPVDWPQEYRAAYTDTAAMGKLLDWKFYPTEEYKHISTVNTRQEILGSVTLRYRIIPSLNVEVSYQGQRQLALSENKGDEASYFVRNLINANSQINRSTGLMRYAVPKGGYLKSDRTETTSSTARFQMNYDKNIGASSLNLLGGFELRSADIVGSGNTLYGYQDDPLSFLPVDNLTPVSNFLTGSAVQISSGTNLTRLQSRFVSVYLNGSYAYKGKYRVSASVRRDGSNVFGASTNDKWKPLWSTGLGWTIAKESFYNVDWLPDLRFSATYGKSGNVDVTRTAAATASQNANSLISLPFVRLRQINNPSLRWEQLSQLNLKMDFATKGNILAGSVSVYRKKGTDLYGSFPYDYTTWGTSAELTRNVAAMEGKGIDLELSSKNVNTDEFQWTSGLFFNFNKSKTLDYYNARNNLSALLSGGTAITPLVGMPLYAVAGYKWGGLDAAGNPQGYVNGALSTNYNAIQNEGRQSGDNIVLIGPANPVYSGAILNSLTLKNFSLSFNISYRLGYFTRKRSISYQGLAGSGITHSDYSLRWQKPGDELITNVPSFLYPINSVRDAIYASSEINIIPADNIRLDYVNLSYRFDAQKWRFPFRSLDVYFNGSNLGLIWKKTEAVSDPDYQDQVGQTKAFTLGVRGSF